MNLWCLVGPMLEDLKTFLDNILDISVMLFCGAFSSSPATFSTNNGFLSGRRCATARMYSLSHYQYIQQPKKHIKEKCRPKIPNVQSVEHSAWSKSGYNIYFTANFLKPFLKGKILRSSERGVNSILTTILCFWPTSWRDRIFCLAASDSARQKDHFQKKICPKRTFPSNFVKLVSKILYLFLAEKMVVCCLLFVVCCCCLLLFVATLSDFGLLFFLIEAFIELRNMLSRKKLYHAWFGNCLTPKVPRFCRFCRFTKMQLT